MATLAIDTKQLRADELRASIEDVKDITSLRLLVFDERGRFLYSSDATMGEVESATSQTDDFLPDAKRDGITQIRKFQKQPYTRVVYRVIHFVANHDWSGFPQDYFAQGHCSAGEFMTHPTMVTTQAQ